MKLWADIPQCHCKFSRLNVTQKDTFNAARRCLTRTVNQVYGFDHPVDENSPIMLHPSCRNVMNRDPPGWVTSACSCRASSNGSSRKRGDMSGSEGSGDNEDEEDEEVKDPFEAWRGKLTKSVTGLSVGIRALTLRGSNSSRARKANTSFGSSENSNTTHLSPLTI